MDAHEKFMAIALEYAKQAQDLGEVPIGAVIVDENDQIIAHGYNQPITAHDPSAHAEMVALRAAAIALQNYRTKPNLRLYVTLEPCTMCAGAISFARISHVIFGAYDVKGGAIVNGAKFFDSASCHFRPNITHGVMEMQCSQILKQFFSEKRRKLP